PQRHPPLFAIPVAIAHTTANRTIDICPFIPLPTQKLGHFRLQGRDQQPPGAFPSQRIQIASHPTRNMLLDCACAVRQLLILCHQRILSLVVSSHDRFRFEFSPKGYATFLPISTPFEINSYEVCELQRDLLHRTGEWSFDIMSHYASVGFEHSETDTLVMLKLRSRSDVDHKAKMWFPQKPFTLRIILGEDTARFRLDLKAGTFVYVDTSSLLRVESPKEIPANLVTMQFIGRDNERARNFVEEVVSRYGSAVKQQVLADGFYPCLAAPSVLRTNVGRKKILNATDLGLLVCFQVVVPSNFANIAKWMSDRQLEEFKRAGNEFSLKGR
ncbi:MAG: hypothetical protein AB1772_11065, partial [Candidatus Zixiibacteriota bacterium]